MAKKRTLLEKITRVFGGSDEDRTGEIVKEANRSGASEVGKMTNEAKQEAKQTPAKPAASRPADPNTSDVNTALSDLGPVLDAWRRRNKANKK